jgi:hypothetical protein
MREFTPADIKNLFGVLNFIERAELHEALGHSISELDWDRFPRNFYALFRQTGDAGREGLAALINSKLSHPESKSASKADYQRSLAHG